MPARRGPGGREDGCLPVKGCDSGPHMRAVAVDGAKQVCDIQRYCLLQTLHSEGLQVKSMLTIPLESLTVSEPLSAAEAWLSVSLTATQCRD